MAKKAASKGATPIATPETEKQENGQGPAATIEVVDNKEDEGHIDEEEVKVNPFSATELKNAADDALKKYLSNAYTQSHTHTNVRLILGWSSVFVALGTGLYSYKTPFEESKPLLWAGVILYTVLTTLQSAYAWFVEGDVVFVGKRKVLDGRIITESLSVSSSSPTVSAISPSPAYAIKVTYARTTAAKSPTSSPSAGKAKTVLKKDSKQVKKVFGEFFDDEGKLERRELNKWLKSVLVGLEA